MTRLRTYDFRCIICAELCPAGWNGEFFEVVGIDEDGEIQGSTPPCPGCGEYRSVIRIPSAPTVLKASWPDGRKRPDSWYIQREAAKLRKESFRKRPEKRGELLGEARRLDSEAHKRFKPEEPKD